MVLAARVSEAGDEPRCVLQPGFVGRVGVRGNGAEAAEALRMAREKKAPPSCCIARDLGAKRKESGDRGAGRRESGRGGHLDAGGGRCVFAIVFPCGFGCGCTNLYWVRLYTIWVGVHYRTRWSLINPTRLTPSLVHSESQVSRLLTQAAELPMLLCRFVLSQVRSVLALFAHRLGFFSKNSNIANLHARTISVGSWQSWWHCPWVPNWDRTDEIFRPGNEAGKEVRIWDLRFLLGLDFLCY